MSHSPIETRPNEEALAALLIVTALSIGSLFSVAKTVGNRLVGSRLKKDVCGTEIDQEPAGTEEEERGIGVNRDAINVDQNDCSRMEEKNTIKSERRQYIHTEAQKLQLLTSHCHRDRDHQKGINTMHTRQKQAMITPPRQSPPQTLNYDIPPPPPPHHESIPQTQSHHDAEHARQHATMRRLQRELWMRRLGYLWHDIGGEGSSEVMYSGWERPVSLQEVSRKMGLRAVGAWEGGGRCWREGHGGGGDGEGEGRWFVGEDEDEDDGRVVLFLW